MKSIGIAVAVAALAVASFVFWFAFFVAAPWIVGMLPQNEWRGLLTVVVYGVVAWFGGVGVPLAIVIWGGLLGIMLYSDAR